MTIYGYLLCSTVLDMDSHIDTTGHIVGEEGREGREEEGGK